MFKLEFMTYLTIFSLVPYKYFNINDEWSRDRRIYNNQMKIVKKFYIKLYGT